MGLSILKSHGSGGGAPRALKSGKQAIPFFKVFSGTAFPEKGQESGFQPAKIFWPMD